MLSLVRYVYVLAGVYTPGYPLVAAYSIAPSPRVISITSTAINQLDATVILSKVSFIITMVNESDSIGYLQNLARELPVGLHCLSIIDDRCQGSVGFKRSEVEIPNQ